MRLPTLRPLPGLPGAAPERRKARYLVASTFGFALSALAGWAARRAGAPPWLATVGVGLFLAALVLFATACVLAVVYQDDARRYHEALAQAKARGRK